MSYHHAESNSDGLHARVNQRGGNIQPNQYDVLSGGGKGNMDCEGNKYFRNVVRQHASSEEKADQDRSVVYEIRSRNGRFLEYDESGHWKEMENSRALKKARTALRDARRRIIPPSSAGCATHVTDAVDQALSTFTNGETEEGSIGSFGSSSLNLVTDSPTATENSKVPVRGLRQTESDRVRAVSLHNSSDDSMLTPVAARQASQINLKEVVQTYKDKHEKVFAELGKFKENLDTFEQFCELEEQEARDRHVAEALRKCWAKVAESFSSSDG